MVRTEEGWDPEFDCRTCGNNAQNSEKTLYILQKLVNELIESVYGENTCFYEVRGSGEPLVW